MNNENSWKEAFEKLQEQLRSILSLLTPFEQDVITMRFGLKNGYSLSLEEVGKKFDITKEGIRRIEAKAIHRLTLKERELKGTNVQDSVEKKPLSDFQNDVLSIINSLTTREQKIARIKYGLDTGIELSDEEVLERFRLVTKSQKVYVRLKQDELSKVIEKVNRRISHKPDEFINIKI
ncbi:MAG: hypothetical protein J5798_13975 [Spirochaetaceae bacterium]|nr:hypothetical protein [Spirochaetaceae bacterium]